RASETESGNIKQIPGPVKETLRELIEEGENSESFDNDEEQVVTLGLGEMSLTLLAAGGDDELTDSEDEWDLFHDELEDFCDLDLKHLCVVCELIC
ncbi:E3 ubiquitin-protein ligase makorin-1, partial [Saguinus oedipus]